MPAPIPPNQAADDSHQLLLGQLDLSSKPKPFRNPLWKPSQRRNKNIKQIVSESVRKEASVLATQNNSGSSTPQLTTGAATPTQSNGAGASVGLTAQNLSQMVLDKNMKAALAASAGTAAGTNGTGGGVGGGPAATYTNIESAPSFHPGSQKHYCDITGLPASYMDPKSRLRYANKEVFEVIRNLPQGSAERYLEARAAHTVLK